MPDLPSRRKHEADLAAAIALAFRSAQQAISTGIVWGSFQRELEAAMQGPLAATWLDAAAQMGGASQDAANSWASAYASALAGEIVTRTRDSLETSSDGAITAAAIAIVFGAERATTIAITETTRAISAAESWIASQAGLLGGESLEPWWVTEQDARVCAVCAPLHDTPQAAWVDVAPGGPPAHPRCRCWLDWRAAA